MDIYQQEVERLQAIPDEQFHNEIMEAWVFGEKHSPLFDVVGNSFTDQYEYIIAGCLTQIRANDEQGAFINGNYDSVLSEQIKSDSRLPKYVESITKESLPVFAEYQRLVKQKNGKDSRS